MIVENYRQAIQALKWCRSEQQRQELGILLAGAASSKSASRDKHGTERRIAQRLGVARGCRSKKRGQRPYAFSSAIRRRTLFNQAVECEQNRVGDVVYVGSCHEEGKLSDLREDGSCTIDFVDPNGQKYSKSFSSTYGFLKGGAGLRRRLPHVGEVVFVGACAIEGTIVKRHDDGRLEIEFRLDGAHTICTYSSAYGKEAGSARIQTRLPSLAPPPPSGAGHQVAESTRKLVAEHFESKCSESPHVRDAMKRRIGPHLYEERQALIKTETYDELFADFDQQHPNLIERAKYIDLAPWNIKDAYRETCLCAPCEGVALYMEGLQVVAQLLKPRIVAMEMERDACEEEEEVVRRGRARSVDNLETPEANPAMVNEDSVGVEARADVNCTAKEANETKGALICDLSTCNTCEDHSCGGVIEEHHVEANMNDYGNEDNSTNRNDYDEQTAEFIALKKLVSQCELRLKSSFIDSLVCSKKIISAENKCIDGECELCHFQSLWSKGYRRFVVDADGGFRADASPVWQQKIRWQRLKAGHASVRAAEDGDGLREGEGQEELKETVFGTPLQLLDNFEQLIAVKATQHRNTRLKAWMTARELHENCWPHVLVSDSDYPENGEIIDSKQLQSDYWQRNYYSLFISITQFLIPGVWLDVESALRPGTEVTVEPYDTGTPPSIEPAEGSYFAVIRVGSLEVGPDVLYTVQRTGVRDTNNMAAIQVRRKQLRERRWHTTAFIGVTNEKRHDGWTTQAMIDWQLKYWKQRATCSCATSEQGPDALPLPGSSSVYDANQMHTVRDQLTYNMAEVSVHKKGTAYSSTMEAEQDESRPTATERRVVKIPSSDVDQIRLDEWRERFGKIPFSAWSHHSDNATHFKSGKMFHYWSRRPVDTEFLKTVWVGFGCPGHGKGAWDGVGAVAKQKNSRDIKNGTSCTTSGQMKSSIDMAENLENYFCSKKWEDKHKNGKINQVVVFHLDVRKINRPVVEPKFSTLQGSSSHFGYLVVRPGVIGARHTGGWCQKCMRARAPGSGLTARLEVLECACHDSRSRGEDLQRCSQWAEHMVERTDASGVANRRTMAQALGHKLARKLHVGAFIAIQAREHWGSGWQELSMQEQIIFLAMELCAK